MDKDLQKLECSNLKSPLLLAWHMTNKCNFNCIHCLENSGLHAAFPDELGEEEAMEVCRQAVELQIPYVALSGGEPLLYPPFWRICEFLSQNGIDIKIESNGSLIDKEKAKKLASFNLRSVQISIDGASQETFSKMRPGGKLEKALNSAKELVRQGAPTEILYCPAKFSKDEVERLVDMAVEIGAKSFYTGKTMYLGKAVENWDIIGLSDKENEELKERLDKKAQEYGDKITILFYPSSVLEELAYRLKYPPASPLLMANGKVRLYNSMPFVCGDVRKQTMSEIWQRYLKAWEHPEVIRFINEVQENPDLLKQANDFVELDL